MTTFKRSKRLANPVLAQTRKFEIWVDRCEEIDPAKPDQVIESASVEDACEAWTDFHGWQDRDDGLIVRDVDRDAWHDVKVETVLAFRAAPARLEDFLG